MTNEPARCPSDLALEEHLLAGAASRLAAHVAGCEGCRARLAQMQREGEDFRRFVFPRTIERIEQAAAGRPRRRWLQLLVPIPALAAAAAVFLLVRPAAPPEDYVGVKGSGGLGLTVFTPGESRDPRVLADGAPVAASAALRFRLRSATPCALVLVSVDGDGNVSRLDPAGAAGFALHEGGQDLPGGVQLDGKPGPERIFAACGVGLTPGAVMDAARRAASGGAAAVRGASELRGLPPRATQATLLLEKNP
jgi:hypothetical protein